MKTLHIKTILVPVDFSKMSAPAIEKANHLAQRFGATVHLVHVEVCYPVAYGAIPAPAPAAPMSWPANLTAELRTAEWRELDELARRFGIPPKNCYLREGIPAFDEICRVAGEIRADLIVMSTHGWSGLKHTFLGSTAERVVQHSPCPVLVARGKRQPIDKILVPVDFSPCSLGALRTAIVFAQEVAAKIIVSHAVHVELGYTADGYPIYDLREITDSAKRAAEAEMQSFVRCTKFGAVKFETRVVVGPPVTQICGLAKDENVDLIITATHGRTGLKHLLTGSVAEQIVRHAPCSVLVVPSHSAVRRQRIGKNVGRKRSLPRIATTAKPLSKRSRRAIKHAFPERRKTNKFRESHSVR